MSPRKYYNLLNNAISNISASHFIKAYKTYKLICSGNNPLAKKRDYRNMYKCAVLCNDPAILNDFYKSNFNYAFVYHNDRVNLLNKDYKIDTSRHKIIYQEPAPSTYEKQTNYLTDSLMETDQEARHKCPGYRRDCVANVLAVDFSSSKLFSKMLDDRRFHFELTLSEDNIYKLMILLKHWHQWGIDLFDTYLKDATEKANFPPDWYADITDYRSGVDSVDVKYKNATQYLHEKQCVTFPDTLVVMRIKDSLAKQIDANRKEIGFMDLKTEREIRWFVQKNTYFIPADFGMTVLKIDMDRTNYMPVIYKMKKDKYIY